MSQRRSGREGKPNVRLSGYVLGDDADEPKRAPTAARARSPPPAPVAPPAASPLSPLPPPPTPTPPAAPTPPASRKPSRPPSVSADNEDEGVEVYPPLAEEKVYTDVDGNKYNASQLKALIKRLYVSEDWPAAFSGVQTNRRELFILKKLDVPSRLVSEALNELDIYNTFVLAKKNKVTVPYDVNSFGEILQLDTGFMPDYMGYKNFLVVQDLFSLRIWAFASKENTSQSVADHFEELLHSEPGLQGHVQLVQSDAGSEFTGKPFRSLLEKLKVKWSRRAGQHKASYAESTIGILKRRIYKEMREKRSDNWISCLNHAVFSCNHLSRPQLGLQQSQSIRSFEDEPRIRLAQQAYARRLSPKMRNKIFPPKPTWQDMAANEQRAMERGTKFRIGQFVYLDRFKKSALSKSFHPQRTQIYVVTSVITSFETVKYGIADLLAHKLGDFYPTQLRRATKDPTQKSYWLMSKIISEKMVNKSVQYRVRFDGYGKNFDEYFPVEKIPPQLLKAYRIRRQVKQFKKKARS